MTILDRPRALPILEAIGAAEFLYSIMVAVFWPDQEVVFWQEIAVASVILVLFFCVTRLKAQFAWVMLVLLSVSGLAVAIAGPFGLGPWQDRVTFVGIIYTVFNLLGLCLLLHAGVRGWVWREEPIARQSIAEID